MQKMFDRMWASVAGRMAFIASLGFVLYWLQATAQGKGAIDAARDGLIILLTGLIPRLAEGGYDVFRAARGQMSSADVPVASDKVDVSPK